MELILNYKKENTCDICSFTEDAFEHTKAKTCNDVSLYIKLDQGKANTKSIVTARDCKTISMWKPSP